MGVETAVGMGLLKAWQADEQNKELTKYNKGQAEMTRYSPWTGKSGQLKTGHQNILAAGAQGALGGAMMGQGLSSMWDKAGEDVAKEGLEQGAGQLAKTAVPTPPMPAAGLQASGPQDLANVGYKQPNSSYWSAAQNLLDPSRPF